MRSKLTRKESLRPPRVFSEQVKKQIVQDIERGKCSVKQACDELLVSHTSIYRWIARFSRYLHQNKRLVVEDKSEEYQTKQLLIRVRELEAALGRKQMELDLLTKVIDLANTEYKTDLKKSFSRIASNGSGSTKESGTSIK
jgi:transposase-like protein